MNAKKIMGEWQLNSTCLLVAGAGGMALFFAGLGISGWLGHNRKQALARERGAKSPVVRRGSDPPDDGSDLHRLSIGSLG